MLRERAGRRARTHSLTGAFLPHTPLPQSHTRRAHWLNSCSRSSPTSSPQQMWSRPSETAEDDPRYRAPPPRQQPYDDDGYHRNDNHPTEGPSTSSHRTYEGDKSKGDSSRAHSSRAHSSRNSKHALRSMQKKTETLKRKYLTFESLTGLYLHFEQSSIQRRRRWLQKYLLDELEYVVFKVNEQSSNEACSRHAEHARAGTASPCSTGPYKMHFQMSLLDLT